MAPAHAGNITLTASDASGTTSFNSAGHWSNAAAPSAGNAYFTNNFQLRSPADGNSYTFAGDSLSIDPTTTGASATRFLLKLVGGTITVNTMLLNGGDVEQASNIAGSSGTVGGGITLNAGTNSGLDASIFTPGTVYLYVNSLISGTGNLIVNRFQASDSSIVELTAANTYTGNTSISNVTNGSGASLTTSTLDLANSLALQNSTLVNGGTTFTQILTSATIGSGGLVAFDSTVGSHAFTFGGMNGTSGLTLADNATTPNPVALSLGNNGASNAYSGVLAGAGSLNKIGAGTQTMSGTNTYSGGTTLTGGKLVASNASALGTGGVTFNGGTLSETASFSAGALSINAGTSFLDFASLPSITDTFSSAGTFTGTLDVLNYSSASGDQFIINGTPLTSGQLSHIVFVNPNGTTGNYSASQSGSQIVVGAAAPEPSSVVAFAMGLVGFGGIAGRRRKFDR